MFLIALVLFVACQTETTSTVDTFCSCQRACRRSRDQALPEHVDHDQASVLDLADPTGQAKNEPAQSAVYAVQLTQEEVDDLAQYIDELGNSNTSAPKAGDFALLVATHVSTREIDNWTWQTFWWQPDVTKLAADPHFEAVESVRRLLRVLHGHGSGRAERA